MARLSAREIKDAASAAVKKAADLNQDGVVDRKDAEQLAVAWEQRFPLGVLSAAVIAGFVLGLVVRGWF